MGILEFAGLPRIAIRGTERGAPDRLQDKAQLIAGSHVGQSEPDVPPRTGRRGLSLRAIAAELGVIKGVVERLFQVETNGPRG